MIVFVCICIRMDHRDESDRSDGLIHLYGMDKSVKHDHPVISFGQYHSNIPTQMYIYDEVTEFLTVSQVPPKHECTVCS